MVSVMKGEFSLDELILLSELLIRKIQNGANLNTVRQMIDIYDKIDGYIDKMHEEMDENE